RLQPAACEVAVELLVHEARQTAVLMHRARLWRTPCQRQWLLGEALGSCQSPWPPTAAPLAATPSGPTDKCALSGTASAPEIVRVSGLPPPQRLVARRRVWRISG